MEESYPNGYKNTVGKGEIARYEQFLLFPQYFQKACFPGASKGVILWEWLTLSVSVFQLYRGGQCTYPCFRGVLLTSTLHNILSKPLAAFPHGHCRNNGQRRERNKSCGNDYHQFSVRILAEPRIEPAPSCSQGRKAND